MSRGPIWSRVLGSRAPLPFWAWCGLALFSAGLYVFAVPYTSGVYELGLPLAFAVATVQVGSLLFAVYRPVLGAAAHLAAVIALAMLTRESDGPLWPVPVPALLSLGALLLILGIRERWVLSLATWWTSVALLVVVIAATPARFENPDSWGPNLIVYTSYTILVLAAAIAVGQRHRIRAELDEARQDIERAQAQRLLIEERARIARELHDVVAHSMSLVHMQALSAPYRLHVEQPAVEREFQDIAASAGAALAEMRQLLGALRTEGVGGELAPQPQVADIQDLAAGAIRAGVAVRVDLDPAATTASPIAQLTAYRIVQEALSNVARHAPSASAEVAVAVRDRAMHVVVRNGETRGDPAPVADRGGEGIRGMRERVGLLGGSLRAEPDRAGGFVVEATLPSAILEREATR